MMRALVLFHDEGTHIFAWFLKPGFKHCAVALEDESLWILIDPKSGLPQIETITDFETRLHDLIKDQKGPEGLSYIETTTRDVRIEGPFLLNNCVGLVKKVLGIVSPFILTPHQLWEYLNVHPTR